MSDEKKEGDPYLDPATNPFLPCGGDAYVIPAAEVRAAAEEIAGKILISKLIAGEASYEAEFGQEAVPKSCGQPMSIEYAAGPDGMPELRVNGKTLVQLDGEEAQAILHANSCLQASIKREEDRQKYLTPANPFVKLD